jgi:hypothetical protein
MLQLKQQLGNGRSEPSMEWGQRLHLPTKTLWIFSNEKKLWKIYSNISRQPTRLKFDMKTTGQSTSGSPPQDSRPCDLLDTGRVQYRQSDERMPPSEPVTFPTLSRQTFKKSPFCTNGIQPPHKTSSPGPAHQYSERWLSVSGRQKLLWMVHGIDSDWRKD